MASPHLPRLRSIYRSLLRELPTHPHPTRSPKPSTLLSHRTHIHQRLRETFSSSSPAATSPVAEQQTPTSDTHALNQAEQFLHYLRAQRLYTTLLERYNPGMDMEEGERVRLSARRVGMDLPVEFKLGS